MRALLQHPLEIIILLKFLLTDSSTDILIVDSFFQEEFVNDSCLVYLHDDRYCMLRDFACFSRLLNVIN